MIISTCSNVYRPIQSEIDEVKQYKAKKNLVELKKKILHSLYEEEEEAEGEERELNEQKAKKKKKKSKTKAVLEESRVEVEESRAESADPLEQYPTDDQQPRKEAKKHLKPKHKKKKNKNMIESMTNERLAAYGIDPKKMKKKLKFSKKQ